MIKLIILLLIFTASTLFSQSLDQLSLNTEKGTYYVPVYNRQSTAYVSASHFADALNGSSSFNKSLDRLTISLAEGELSVTSKNPYLVFIDKKSKSKKVIQLPTSTYLINEQIFIPLPYTLEILKQASGAEITKTGNLSYSVKNILNSKPAADQKPAELKPVSIMGISIDEKANGTLVRIKSKKKIPAFSSTYKEGILTLRLNKVFADVDKINALKGKGLVKEVKARNADPGTEIQFVLTKEYTTSEVIGVEGSNDIILTIHNKIFSRSDLDKNKSKWELDVIVIDAGHGGKDHGAIAINGAREKDINLDISLKLGKIIEQNLPGVKVVYTRNNDKFVELYKRGKIANDAGGKLFISIHCNSTPKKSSSANGFEVYLLRPGRTKEAIAIAERENSVIQYEDNPQRYQQLTDENFILVSMAHSSYLKYSEKFSEFLEKQFSKDLPLSSRGVKQAGFYVLVGASMPSVLIEAGFLSNKKDADYLKSQSGQEKIAQSIFEGIKKYKTFYTESLEAEI